MGKSTKSVTAASSSSSKPKSAAASHKRASVACVSCKTRRTRCVKPDNSKICLYCDRHNLECTMTEDERKRSTSKAYLDSLRNRILLLEEMLKRTGAELPPVEVVGESKESVKGGQNQKTALSSSQKSKEQTNSSMSSSRDHNGSIERRETFTSFGNASQFSETDGCMSRFRDTSPQSHSHFRESFSMDGGNAESDWSLVSAASRSASSQFTSVPSLSSGDDEVTDFFPETFFSEEDETSFEGGRETNYGLMENEGEWKSDLAIGLEKRGSDSWEGQAALLDMGFMLGLGAEEVLAVQKGMSGVAQQERYPYR